MVLTKWPSPNVPQLRVDTVDESLAYRGRSNRNSGIFNLGGNSTSPNADRSIKSSATNSLQVSPAVTPPRGISPAPKRNEGHDYGHLSVIIAPKLQRVGSSSALVSAADQLAQLRLRQNDELRSRKEFNFLTEFDAGSGVLSENGNSRYDKDSYHDDEDEIEYAQGYQPPKIVVAEQPVAVYVHKIRPSDTLPFLLLSYGISADNLRKANRLWPNDSIFTRTELLMPIKQCQLGSVQITTESPLIDLDENSDNKGNVNDEDFSAVIPNIGKVKVVYMPPSFLSYFPSNTSLQQRRSSSHTNSNMGRPGLGIYPSSSPRQSQDNNASHSNSLLGIGFKTMTATMEDKIIKAWQGWKTRKWERDSLDEIHEMRPSLDL